MLIANPIYDVYFKYLMEDNEIAKEFIGTIIDEEIVELTLKPQETILQMKEFAFTILKMDFQAIIQTKEGKKNVLIEMQKGKYVSDLQRFRTYLGERYSKDDLPIITIYFLGYPMDKNLPAVTFVKREYYDRFTNQKLDVKSAFVESLTHNSYIIQILLLDGNMKSKLSSLLSVFDQTKQETENYILSVPDQLPEEKILRKIILRLQMAGSTEELRKKAQFEKDIEKSFKSMAREIQENQQIIQKKEEIIQEKDQTIQEKDLLLKEQEKLIQELKKKLEK